MSAHQVQQLVKMANQIALNLGAGRSEQQAALETGKHIIHFWTQAMRLQLLEYWRGGGEGIAPVVASFLEVEVVAGK
jgi:hypothetical protein